MSNLHRVQFEALTVPPSLPLASLMHKVPAPWCPLSGAEPQPPLDGSSWYSRCVLRTSSSSDDERNPAVPQR